MASYRMKTMDANAFRIDLNRKRVGSVWRKAGEPWQATLETSKGTKVQTTGRETAQEAFHAVVAMANRVALGVAADDAMGARAIVAAMNERVEAQARELNALAGYRRFTTKGKKVAI